MSSILAYLGEHPALLTAVVWPPLTAILTAIFKPQTPEQYAALAAKHPRLADFWRLVGALGLDPVKAVMVVQQLLSPVHPPDANPNESIHDKDTLS